MKRIDERTVELTTAEQEVKEVFDLMLAEGINTTQAARYAVAAMPRASKNFIEYLSDGTLTKVKGKVVETAVA